MQNTREENRGTNMFFKVKADKLPSTSGYAYAVSQTYKTFTPQFDHPSN